MFLWLLLWIFVSSLYFENGHPDKSLVLVFGYREWNDKVSEIMGSSGKSAAELLESIGQLESLVNEVKRFIITGAMGSGKSTVLKLLQFIIERLN